MVRYTFLVGFLISTCPYLWGQGSLEKQKINKNITINLPTAFVPMNTQLQRRKYVSDRPPVAMFTTPDNKVDLGINETSTNWGEDLNILRDLYRSGIQNLYDEVQFSLDTIREVNGRKFISFEFVGTVKSREDSFRAGRDLSKYIFIMYTPYREKVLLFNFSAPASYKDAWGPTVNEMMNSIRIR